MKEFLFMVLCGYLFIAGGRCQDQLVSRCQLPPVEGDCSLRLMRWYYDSSTGFCNNFVYTGCGGNMNNFEYKAGCERHCIKGSPNSRNTEASDDSDDDFTDGLDDVFGSLFGRPTTSLFNNMFPSTTNQRFRFGNPRTRFSRIGLTDGFWRPRGLFTNPFFNSFNPNQGQQPSTNENKSPISEVLGLLHKTPLKPLIKPMSRSTVKLHNLFTRPLGSKSFQSVFTKTLESIGEDFDKSVKTMTNTVVTSGSGSQMIDHEEAVKCEICQGVVKIVQYEIKTMKLPIKIILDTAKLICGFFPLQEKYCNAVIKDIKEMIDYMEHGLTPKQVCINISMCPNTTLPEGTSQNVSISFSRSCPPLCQFMKAAQEENMRTMKASWNSSRVTLQEFCARNKILNKCDRLYQLIDGLNDKASNVTAPGEGCNCFNKQPIFETKKFDSCFRCKQFQKGMFNELQDIDRSVNTLTKHVKQLCDIFPGDKSCKDASQQLQQSLKANKLMSMPDICEVTGYCGNDDSSIKQTQLILKEVQKAFDSLKGLFPDPASMMFPGMKLSLKKFSPGCVFCKQCMGDLKETFKKNNVTITTTNAQKIASINKLFTMPTTTAEPELRAPSVSPSVKEGFDMYCTMKAEGEDYKTVCKKIADGIETVHDTITGNAGANEEAACGSLGVC